MALPADFAVVLDACGFHREYPWFDGVCLLCGHAVEEGMADDGREDDSGFEDLSDYRNRCTNPDCAEHRWHYVGDQEFLEYYEHRRG